jgi:hypothetical protein
MDAPYPEKPRSEAVAPRRPLIVFGAVLMVIGLAIVAGRIVDVELENVIGEQTWPFFVIVPGLVLLVAAIIPRPPDGLGFAIAGSIVTSVGVILLFQANTDAWASWSYVWALIPGAAGLGMAGYGLLTRRRELIGKGVRLAVIAAVLFVIGAWYFETWYATGDVPVDAASWWPIVLIGVGAFIAIRALLGDRRSTSANAHEGGSEP